ncbi:NAD(P)H-binding protein [Kibdelosporangium philippinense]|uniref:NAD(P)H-binding protein n=1 Tax=Kibdelosporangium philippinense TaxID=211113 RepID=A0ABS8ZFD8_9PSEU|nr:NAD(P)H-binding protein [Kibdelosporangium philippinense]MCE7006009.1 NAD(P)H-binding protein [Kibdelosporangium philippinense]
MTILVLGATGKTGSRLVRTLVAGGSQVRAASRSGSVPFDWSLPSTWEPALAGVRAVYLLAPQDPAAASVFVKQAVQAGVTRFVALSGRAIDQFPGYFLGMTAAEEAARDSGAEWTIIRPNNFNQNFSASDIWASALRAGSLGLPMDATPEPFIDAQDIADVAAVLLTSDGHHGQVYDLSGPRGITFADAVAKIGAATGRSMEFVEVTAAEYRASLLAEGASEEVAAELNALYDGMKAGLYTVPADGVQRVLGREPIDFDTYVARAAAEGAWR